MARVSTTVAYNGTSWSDVSGGDTNLAGAWRSVAGSASSAVMFAGGTDSESPEDATELWNGSTWANSTNMAHKAYGGTGHSATDAIQTCGTNDPTNQLLDGTTWSDSVECTQNTQLSQTAGTSVDCMKASGYHYATDNNSYTLSETLDGTTWSSAGTVINEGSYGTAWGDGANFFLRYGGIDYNSPYGSPTPHTCNRVATHYDGTSWATTDQAPDGGGTNGGLYNGTAQSATIGNTGAQGAVYHAGTNLTYTDTHAKQEYTWEATW